MQTTLKAGATLDMPNAKEIGDAVTTAIRAWMTEAIRGAKPKLFSAAGIVDAAGNLALGGNDWNIANGQLGPDAGFVWSVKRIAVRIAGVPAAAFSVFVSSDSGLTLIKDVPVGDNGYAHWGSDSNVLTGPQQLLVTATGAGAGAQATISGMAIEFPVGLIWKMF